MKSKFEAGRLAFTVKARFTHMPKLEAANDGLAILGSITTSLVPASYPPKQLTAPQGTMQP